jgi:hypothetical protein
LKFHKKATVVRAGERTVDILQPAVRLASLSSS